MKTENYLQAISIGGDSVALVKESHWKFSRQFVCIKLMVCLEVVQNVGCNTNNKQSIFD